MGKERKRSEEETKRVLGCFFFFLLFLSSLSRAVVWGEGNTDQLRLQYGSTADPLVK